MLLCDIAWLKARTENSLALPVSLIQLWTLVSSSKDTSLFSWEVPTPWMENFLGKVAFAIRSMKDVKKFISVSLGKYELSVIHVFCGETDGVAF